MDICFVSNVCYPFITGGAEKRIHEVGTRLAERGHSVTLYSRHFWDGPPTTTHEGMTIRAVAPEADLYEDERRSITEAIDFAARLAPPLRKQLREDNHDLIVASVFPYFPVLSSKLVSIGTDTPLVTTWHEVWGDYWDEYLGRLAFGGKLVERVTARTPQHPITISEITANRLAEIGPERERIEVVPNGIDIEQIQSAPLPENTYDALFAGRLIEHKNVDLFLDAFDSIAADHNATLGIIGDGPERDALEAQTENLTHRDRIDFLGFLENYDDVLGHMRAADVFCSPSTREGFGLTFAEAMAANCTVIAVDHADSAADEVIADAGFLAEPNVESLTDVLKRALSGERPDTNPEERARRYDWETVADQAERAYRRAIDGDW
jgi:glycosyltransferase involved in cell wall biosynthesis